MSNVKSQGNKSQPFGRNRFEELKDEKDNLRVIEREAGEGIWRRDRARKKV